MFAPNVSIKTDERVALIVDNASSHADMCIPDSIDLIELPANVTALHQPMDMGVIKAWKTAYRKIMLRSILQDLESRISKREENRNQPKGTNGLAQGYDPHMAMFADCRFRHGKM